MLLRCEVGQAFLTSHILKSIFRKRSSRETGDHPGTKLHRCLPSRKGRGKCTCSWQINVLTVSISYLKQQVSLRIAIHSICSLVWESKGSVSFFSEKEKANITQWLDSNAFELTRKMELKRLTCLLKGMKEIEMFVLISVLVRLAWFQDLPRREYHLCAHPSREGNVTKHAPRWLWLHSRVCLAYQQASRARVLHNHKQDARVFEILEEQHNVITGIKTHPGFLRGLKKKSRKESA